MDSERDGGMGTLKKMFEWQKSEVRKGNVGHRKSFWELGDGRGVQLDMRKSALPLALPISRLGGIVGSYGRGGGGGRRKSQESERRSFLREL